MIIDPATSESTAAADGRPKPGKGRAAKTEPPKRGPYFALHYLRALSDNHVAGTGDDPVGADAVWLLSVVVLMQDRRRDYGAITFFNDELSRRCGLSDRGTKRARDRAVRAGLLHYESGSKGKAGRYWVLDPEGWCGPGPTANGAVAPGIPGQPDPETVGTRSRIPGQAGPLTARQSPIPGQAGATWPRSAAAAT
jgi:hypothetical protein